MENSGVMQNANKLTWEPYQEKKQTSWNGKIFNSCEFGAVSLGHWHTCWMLLVSSLVRILSSVYLLVFVLVLFRTTSCIYPIGLVLKFLCKSLVWACVYSVQVHWAWRFKALSRFFSNVRTRELLFLFDSLESFINWSWKI